MTLSRDEAKKALAEIGQAGERSARLRNYRYGAPHMLIWGVIWLVANSATAFWPRYGGWAWVVGIACSVLFSFVQSAQQVKANALLSPADQERARRVAWQWGVTSLVIIGFFVAFFTILAPMSARKFNAAISLLWMFIYMGAGVWIGWRMFVIGALAAIAILVGYYGIERYFDLWMGVVGGSALIAGGLWLRKA